MRFVFRRPSRPVVCPTTTADYHRRRAHRAVCPMPPSVEDGLYALSANTTVFGSRAYYSCLPGYDLIGESSLVCNNAGYWDGQPPLCRGT